MKKFLFSGIIACLIGFCLSCTTTEDSVGLQMRAGLPNFNYSEDGLMIGRKEGKKEVEEDKIGKLQGFVIAGEDKVWYWADAKIEGNSVIVSSPFVNKPIAVRYAFSMNPRGANLYNRSGLPASPFRSDCW